MGLIYLSLPQDLILLFKFPMGMRKNFFEIYREFGHASSERFVSPRLFNINVGVPQV